MDRAASQSGADQNRIDLPQGLYTGIWWYGKFPHHYAGEGAAATKELGEFDMKAQVANVVNVLRAIKADQMSPRLQQEFFEGAKRPNETKQ
jgi:creatinine amidohydrolase